MEIIERVPKNMNRMTMRSLFRQKFFSYYKGVICRTLDPNLASQEMHGPLCDWMQRSIATVPRAGIIDPRNHGKSTLEVSLMMWLATQRPNEEFDSDAEVARANDFLKYHKKLRGVDDTNLLISGSEGNTKALSKFMMTFYESDPFHQFLFPELTPGYAQKLGEDLTWGVERWILPGRKAKHPQGYIETAGLGSRLAMRHFRRIFLDDPVNEQTWDSVDELLKAKEFIEHAKNLLEVSSLDHEYASPFWMIGNYWSDRDVMTYARETQGDSWKFWIRSCWVCSKCGRQNCIRSKECSFTDEPLWKARYTRNGLLQLKKDQGPVIFCAQYENEPYSAGAVEFDLTKLGRFVFDEMFNELVVFAKDANTIEKRIPLSSLRLAISVDPASSTDPLACNSAIVLCGEDADQRVYLLDCAARQMGTTATVQEVLNMYAKWTKRGGRIVYCGYEGVGGQRYIVPALVATAAQRNLSAFTEPIPGADYNFIFEFKTDRQQSKIERIRVLLSWRVNAGLLYVDEALPHKQIFDNEIARFPSAKTLDVIDAVAYSEQMFSRVLRDENVQRNVREFNERLRFNNKRLPF